MYSTNILQYTSVNNVLRLRLLFAVYNGHRTANPSFANLSLARLNFMRIHTYGGIGIGVLKVKTFICYLVQYYSNIATEPYSW